MKRGSLEVLKCEGGAHPRLWCNLISVPEVEAWDILRGDCGELGQLHKLV